MPDVRSFTRCRGSQSVARFACDVHVEGEAWPYCPRTILRRQLARARSLGFEFKIGLEAEYFLVRKREDGSIELADPLDTLDQPCYDMRGLTRNFDFLTDALAQLTRSAGATTRPTTRTPTASSSRTSSTPTRSTTCDRAIFFRYMVQSLAQQRGMIATFMPKPFVAPDRQRLPLPHEPVARRRRTSSRRIPPTTRAGSGCRRPPTTSSAG